MRTNTTTTLYECDRCGRRVANPWATGEPDDTRWATITIQVTGVADEATFPIGVGPKDICPSCIKSFVKFWKVVVKEPA